jgi:4-oxalocrotonate tautomerase
MPYVNIKITRDGATAEQKAALIKGVSDVLLEVLNKPLTATYVVIDEVEPENWGAGGQSVAVQRRQAAAKSAG